MSISALFVEIRSDTAIGGGFRTAGMNPRGDSAIPFLPHMLRIDAEEDGPRLERVTPIYLHMPRLGYQAIASGRWTCEVNEGDGRLGNIEYLPTRPMPTAPYDELLATLNTIALFAQGLLDGDRRRFGLLACAKGLIAFWRNGEARLRAALVPPFDSTLI